MQPPHHSPGEGNRSGNSILPPHQVSQPLPSCSSAGTTRETSSSSRNTSPASRPHKVLPVDIGNQVAAQGAQEQAPLNWPLPTSHPTPTVMVPRDPGELDTAVTPTAGHPGLDSHNNCQAPTSGPPTLK